MDVEQLAAFIAQKGKSRSPRPDEIAKEIQCPFFILDVTCQGAVETEFFT